MQSSGTTANTRRPTPSTNNLSSSPAPSSQPTLSFQSTSISRVADGELSVEGDLTIRGVKRKVVFAVEGPTSPTKDPWGNTRIGISATTKINRRDFGLVWNAALEAGGILVGDEVTITVDAQFTKA